MPDTSYKMIVNESNQSAILHNPSILSSSDFQVKSLSRTLDFSIAPLKQLHLCFPAPAVPLLFNLQASASMISERPLWNRNIHHALFLHSDLQLNSTRSSKEQLRRRS